MSRAKTHNAESKLCAAALRLAAKHGWNALTLDQIASTAKIPLAHAQKTFPNKNGILPALVRQIDRQVKAATGKIDPHASPRDRLFEVMMARFDALQEHRDGILAILNDCRCDPTLARAIVPAQIHSLRQMLSLARLDSAGIPQPLVIFGLLAVYYRALWRWQKDRTSDMAGTMAALDQGLRCANTIVEILLRGK